MTSKNEFKRLKHGHHPGDVSKKAKIAMREGAVPFVTFTHTISERRPRSTGECSRTRGAACSAAVTDSASRRTARTSVAVSHPPGAQIGAFRILKRLGCAPYRTGYLYRVECRCGRRYTREFFDCGGPEMLVDAEDRYGPEMRGAMDPGPWTEPDGPQNRH